MAKKEKETSSLIKALQFISKAQKDSGTSMQTHCVIANGKITASDGVITAGCMIEEDLNAFPHTYKLLSALQKCGKEYSITQTDPGKLVIKSGKFQANVLCVAEELPIHGPDAAILPCGDVLKVALRETMHIAVEGANKVYMSAVLLQDGACLATTGFVMLQYYHGIQIPSCVLPKIFCSILCSIDKKIVSVGGSQSSFTVWFEDNSWIKTQLYAESFPACNDILKCPGDVLTIAPKGFYDALNHIEDFSDGKEDAKQVWITPEGLCSHKDKLQGAFYELKGIPEASFKIKQLKQIESAFKKYYFADGRMWFFGDNIRGVIIGLNA